MLTAEINRSRRIGVEYEMTVPLVGNGSGMDVQRTLANVLTANGIRAIARGYSHELVPDGVDVAVEYDSSVVGERKWQGVTWFAVEIKTRILSGIDDWERIVPKMLDIASYMGARVNASCGHHVHVSLPEVIERPKVVRSLTSLVARIEPIIYGLVAPSRRQSTYCCPLGSDVPQFKRCKTLDDLSSSLSGWSRYRGLNLTNAASTAPRVEYRYHHGTLDVDKARHWLRLLLQVTEHAITRNCQSLPEPLPNTRQGFERMATAVGMRVNSKIYRSVSAELAETASYLLRRWKHFNGHPMRAPRQTLAAAAMERELI
jgi:hypothetical protein